MSNRPESSFFRILPLYIVIFIGFVGYSLTITILTPLILEEGEALLNSLPFTGDPTIILGIVLAIYPVGQFFGAPIMGALSDRFGRKPVLIISLCMTTICFGVLGYAIHIQNLSLFIVISLIMGLAEANIATAQSAVADVTTEENRTRMFAYINLSASGAFIVGPLLGGVLADPHLVPWFNNSTPYWAVFILLIMTAIFTFTAFKETRPKEKRTEVSYSQAFTNLLEIFKPGKLRIIYLVNFLIYLAIFGFFRAFPMYLVEHYGMDVTELAKYIAWNAVPVVIGSLWLTGYLSKLHTPRTIAIYSTLLFGLFNLFVILPQSEFMLYFTLFLPGLALAVALPVSASMISLAAGEDAQGRALGNNLSIEVGAEVLSGLAAGFLAAYFIKLPMFAICAVAILAAAILFFSNGGKLKSS
jgi:DHA1 family tetracycline resistance protein-like MFS transporter